MTVKGPSISYNQNVLTSGVHTIHVTYLGAPIGDSPYQVKTYDPKLVRLSKMPLGILNIPFKFRGTRFTTLYVF